MREPTNDEQRLMIIGQFETLEEMMAWMNTPLPPDVLAKLGEPDELEEALAEIREMAGMSEDEDDLEDEEDLDEEE
jgi:antibiotic biosynthesis monooxygenase (ABM) superfamily enzyme